MYAQLCFACFCITELKFAQFQHLGLWKGCGRAIDDSDIGALVAAVCVVDDDTFGRTTITTN